MFEPKATAPHLDSTPLRACNVIVVAALTSLGILLPSPAEFVCQRRAVTALLSLLRPLRKCENPQGNHVQDRHKGQH